MKTEQEVRDAIERLKEWTRTHHDRLDLGWLGALEWVIFEPKPSYHGCCISSPHAGPCSRSNVRELSDPPYK